jgi:hypothetical protein
VASFLIEIVAPGVTAPEASNTVPFTVAVVESWAHPGTAARKPTITKQSGLTTKLNRIV